MRSEPRRNWSNRFSEYLRLMRIDRPIGMYLLLWPTLWALWIAAQGRPQPWVVVVFVAGVFIMRSAGCVINDYADRDLDPHVSRTRDRPLAARRVAPAEALMLFAVLCLIAFALVSTLNALTIWMSVAGAVLAASYPFMKRFHHLPQAHLGAAFGWAVPMAFAAQTGAVPALAWLLYGVTILWAVAYDTQYAMVDRDDDLRIGVGSTAILFGRFDRLAVAAVQALVVAGLWIVGEQAGLGWPYRAGVLCAVMLMVYQQILIRGRDPSACFTAFLNNNWVGLLVFLGIAANYALLR